MRPRIVVVSYHAANRLTPRGARSQAVAAALARQADVRLIGGLRETGPRRWWHRARDRLMYEVGSRWLIDPIEPWAWRTLGRWDPRADAALLIGYPFSPLVVAAGACRRHGVPYIVDVSDPWAATRSREDASPALWDRRAHALERRLWRGASGGIVTTPTQASDVRRLVPALDVLVRPNGYVEVHAPSPPRRNEAQDELRIGHFGNLYAPRVDIRRFFRRLAESGFWRRIVVRQYGRDHHHELRKLGELVTVESYDPVPWPEVVRRTADLDIALVIGNKDPRQLPSKAIEYLTLPVPRLALTASLEGDALAEYVDGKSGWLIVDANDEAAAARVREHLRRRWTATELAPPEAESWGAVANELAGFVMNRMSSARDQSPTRS